MASADIAGFYAALGSLAPGMRIEPYWFYNDRPRMQGVIVDETPAYTFGTRLEGRWGEGWDYDAELAGQRGHAPGLDQCGWLGHAGVGYQSGRTPWTPRMFAAYEQASGDRNLLDGRIGTWDAGFGRRHRNLGEADAVGRSNLKALESGVECWPIKAVLVRLSYFHFRTAQRAGGLYGTNGLVAIPPPASRPGSSRLGDELDLHFEWSPNRVWFLEAGLARFVSGAWLEQTAGRVARRDIAYLSVRWKL